MRRLLLLAALGFLACTVRAQEYVWRHYGAEAGLPVAYTVTFDGVGTLLVGTNDGLARFDGRVFGDVSLPVRGVVWRLAAAPNGIVWGLTNQAGLFYLAPDGSAQAVPIPPALRARLKEQIWPIRLHTDARSRLWLSGGDGALYRWNGPDHQNWSVFRVPDTDFVADFFFCGGENGDSLVVASRYRVGIFPLHEDRLGPPGWLPPFPARLTFLRPHPDMLAWVGGNDGVYLLSDQGQAHRVTAAGRRAWPHHEPDVDAAGRLLTVLEGNAEMITTRFAPDGTREFTAGVEEGLGGVLPLRFLFAPEGGFWIAHTGGLTMLEDEESRTYLVQREGGSLDLVNDIAGDPARGVLWVSTYGGMYRFDGRRLAYVGGPENRMSLFPIVGADGEADWVEHEIPNWFGRSSRSPPPGGRPVLVYDGPSGRYETDEAGFWRLRSGQRVRIGPDFLPGATGSADSAGRLWLGGEPGRLDVVWGDSLGSACEACLPASLRTALDTLNARLAVGWVAADPFGHIWVQGATGGLGVLWPQPDASWSWKLMDERDGLMSQLLSSIALSPDGQRLWLATSRGIQGVHLRPGPPQFEAFVELRARDGLEGESASGILEDSDGYLWTSLVPGKIHRLDWRALADRPPSPAVRIERIEVNGHWVEDWRPGLSLREGDGLTVRLAAQTYRQPLRVRLEYRLAGYDTAWINLGLGRQITLAALPAGRYALEAHAVREGRPPGRADTAPLVVTPPFWRTPWFAALVALACALTIYAIRRVQQGRRREAEALRRRIAEDLHDEVGSGLTQVTLYSELIRRLAEGTAGDNGQPKDAGALVAAWAARVGEQATALSGAMRDVIWAIQPEEDAWDALELRMKDTAVALLAPHRIKVDMAGQVEGTPPALSPEIRQNVLLFFKEAVHNAARHAAPSRVEVRWRLSHRALSLRIADDGRGFDPATARHGLGLTSLRRRADDLGASFTLTTAPGTGTSLQLDVPLRDPWSWWKPHRLTFLERPT